MSEGSSMWRREFIAGTTTVTTGLALTEVFASGTNSHHGLRRTDFLKLIGHRFEVDGTSEQETRQRGPTLLARTL
jgi:hypothetical protein